MDKRKKYYYYILVFTTNGPRYVTSIGDHHTAYWKEENAPKEFSKKYARDVVIGLNLNFWNAVLAESPLPLHNQPDNYKDYKINFIEKEKDEDEEEE